MPFLLLIYVVSISTSCIIVFASYLQSNNLLQLVWLLIHYTGIININLSLAHEILYVFFMLDCSGDSYIILHSAEWKL